MKRRNFIKNSWGACLSVTAFHSLLNGCTPTQYINGKLEPNGLKVQKDQFKIGNKGSYNSFIIVRNDELLFPICIFRFSEQEYSAIWLKCAHMGAEVNVMGDKLHCPAHGSEYDNRGQVTNGPAISNLKTFPVVVGKTDLFIDLRKQS